jgi:hypothetical protein
MYAFDNSPLSVLFRNYYRKRFPTLWDQFDQLVCDGRLVSTREVKREIDNCSISDLRTWADANPNIFTTPTAAEAAAVGRIYAVHQFQQNIARQKLLKGGILADPFVVAKAMTDGLTVVTMELFKPNAAKIPNICQHFNVPCLTLEKFMEAEGWEF